MVDWNDAFGIVNSRSLSFFRYLIKFINILVLHHTQTNSLKLFTTQKHMNEANEEKIGKNVKTNVKWSGERWNGVVEWSETVQ